MVESVTDRKTKSAAPFGDMGVPMAFERAKPRIIAHNEDEDDEEEESVPTMQFQMLTRKGPKGVNAHALQVPLECTFAAKTLAKEQVTRATVVSCVAAG